MAASYRNKRNRSVAKFKSCFAVALDFSKGACGITNADLADT
jgi:hypothetical protein